MYVLSSQSSFIKLCQIIDHPIALTIARCRFESVVIKIQSFRSDTHALVAI